MGLLGLVATLTVKGAVNPLCFDVYLDPMLAPKAATKRAVVLDNLGVHRASLINEVAAERGTQVLWLVPKSPDFSPIEQCWSKIKNYLCETKVRTNHELDKALSQASDS